MAAKLTPVPPAEPTGAIAPELAPLTPVAPTVLRPLQRERGGYHLFYRVIEAMWLILSHVLTRSMAFGPTRRLMRNSMTIYENWLETRLGPPLPSFADIAAEGLLRRKHIAFAAYMATLSSLPMLAQRASASGVMRAVLAKTSLGASTKLLDNLNDRYHGLEEAKQVLRELMRVMTTGRRKNAPSSGSSRSAEVVGLELARWVFESIRGPRDAAALLDYKADVVKLVAGQLASLGHKSAERSPPTVARYLRRIAEKSIGDVWLDIDLCLLEEACGPLKPSQRAALELLKSGNDLVFKSSLLYDDAQDLLEDLRTNSVNVCTLLAIERGVITETDLKLLSPLEVYALLRRTGILQMTIKLADMVFLSGIREIVSTKRALQGIVHVDALLLGYRFVRLFNLRKLVEERPDPRNVTEFLSCLMPFSCMWASIPSTLRGYERFLQPEGGVQLHISYS